VSVLCKIMVLNILELVTEYERRLRRTPFVPRLSFGRPMLTDDGGPNAMFFTCLFCDEPMGLEFVQDAGLLRSKELCKTCGGNMTWSVDSSSSDGYRWRCRRRTGGIRCIIIIIIIIIIIYSSIFVTQVTLDISIIFTICTLHHL